MKRVKRVVTGNAPNESDGTIGKGQGSDTGCIRSFNHRNSDLSIG